MKHFIFFIFLSAIGFAQSTYYYADSLKSTDTTNTHTLFVNKDNPDYDFITIKITLSNAGDSVYVKTGLSNNTGFGKVGLKDQLTGDNVQLITGNTDANRGYLVLYAPRASYINLYTTDLTLGGTINYKIEAR